MRISYTAIPFFILLVISAKNLAAISDTIQDNSEKSYYATSVFSNALETIRNKSASETIISLSTAGQIGVYLGLVATGVITAAIVDCFKRFRSTNNPIPQDRDPIRLAKAAADLASTSSDLALTIIIASIPIGLIAYLGINKEYTEQKERERIINNILQELRNQLQQVQTELVAVKKEQEQHHKNSAITKSLDSKDSTSFPVKETPQIISCPS